MVRVSAGDVQRQWGRIQDLAIVEPLTVTCNGRDRIVMLSTDEYRRLKKRDRDVLTLADFTLEDLQTIRDSEPPSEAAKFDHEVNG